MSIDLRDGRWLVLLVPVLALLVGVVLPRLPGLRGRVHVQETAIGEKGIVHAKGRFRPGGNIVLSLSPVKSINGWHKSECSIRPLLTQSQQEARMDRILYKKHQNFRDGIFGHRDIPSRDLRHKFIGGVTDPVNIELRYAVRDNRKVVGETVLLEVECTISYPYLVGENEYAVRSELFSDAVPIQLHE